MLPISSRLFIFQSGVKTPTVLSGFEDQLVLYGREVQATKSVPRGAMNLGRIMRKFNASLTAITTAIELHVPVAADLSYKSVQPIPQPFPWEKTYLILQF